MKPVVCGFLLLPLALLFGSCLNDEAADIARCPESECGPLTMRDSYFSIAVGNSWTFTDDSGVDSGGSVESFTVAVMGWDSGALYSGGGGPHGVWWDFVVTPPADGVRNYAWLSTHYWSQGDSVYARQAAMGGGFVSALSYLVPPGTDTIKWNSTYGGDVGIEMSATHLQDSVTVPAGTFAPCIAYEYHAIEAHRSVLCAGVGWVSFDVGSREIRLIDYTIVP